MRSTRDWNSWRAPSFGQHRLPNTAHYQSGLKAKHTSAQIGFEIIQRKDVLNYQE